MITLLLPAVAAAQTAETSPKSAAGRLSAADIAAIRATSERWEAAARAGRWEDVAATFTHDAILRFPDAAYVGRAAILKYLQGLQPFDKTRTLHIDEIDGRGDMAFVMGHSTITPPGGGTPIVVGRYLDIRRRQADGSWLFYRDMVSPVPQPGQPVAPARPVLPPQITQTSPQLEQRDQPVTADDIAILVRAQALLSSNDVWNRADDRECTDDEASGKRSLFCALQRASIDVLGSYDHRRVALQEVRFAVEDATRGRNFDHRLRDFNNLPETRLEDVQRILTVAKERVRARVKTGPGAADVAAAQTGDDPESRLRSLGLTLPASNVPAGNYVSAVRTGNLIFLATHGECGTSLVGKVGKDVTLDSAAASARRIGLCLLSTLKNELGDLRRVVRIVRVTGMVNAAPDFTDLPRVIDGCSDLLVAVFGDRGRHARGVLGVASMAGGRSVGIEMVVEVRD